MGSDEHFIPRNYRIGILNGALWMGGSAFLDPDAVVAVFLLGLGASKFVVGIAAAASMVGFLLPTLLMAHLIEAAEHKLRYYYLSMASRVLTLGVLVVSVLLLGPSHPRVLCGLAIALLCGYNASIAVGVLPFFEVVGHSVPPRRRGRFFAWRMVLGNALAIAAGVAVAWLLNEKRSGLTFSQSFAVVFGL
ncbi:MFS transporter, partial [bacterium]|nr:MFS transporter [bacterium]